MHLEKNTNIKYSKMLFAGLINTLIGYLSLFILTELLLIKYNIFFIALTSRFFTIFCALIIYKYFVFKTQNKLFKYELFKIYLVYFISTIFFSIIIYFFVDFFKVNFHLSTFLAILINFLMTTKGHIDFTFSKKKSYLS